ncbi:MAG: magnesium/cobalt transporter CorA [Armatimonadetes bacterium]|nr:magnesium/cobalt transporter CorA [Armatimonadota bacterium]
MTREFRSSQHTPPGTIIVHPEAPPPCINILAFGTDELQEKEAQGLEELPSLLARYPVLWLNVDGLGDAAVITRIGELFDLHQLTLEDVANVGQRAKVEDYPNYTFLVLRMLYIQDDYVSTEQLSLIMGKNFVITFQEGIPGDSLEPVRTRLRKETSRIRCGGADFLAYSIIDAVVDAYFPILERLGEELEEKEDQILLHPSRSLMEDIHRMKRDLLTVRRAVWPLREVLNPLFREEKPLVSPGTRIFLRDCYDHTVQLVELIETYRELASSLMDIYLSSISNRMNETMRVLAIITTIFVPLTFVAGIYGMNFNTERSPWNMPELEWYYGYPVCLLSMLIVALLELVYFFRRGWIGPRADLTQEEKS